MAADNAEQIAEWNGAMGHIWAERQKEIDRIIVPFGAAAMQAAAPKPGERVIDIGCGCGDTSVEIAQKVGPTGAVLGVDVSQPMLDVARALAAQGRHENLEFRETDASEADLPDAVDLLFSRFGVMFFSQPLPAFSHMRKSLRKDGRCVFVCWRTPKDNSWAMAPLAAARAAMGITPAPADPAAPGPFAFADADRVRALLGDAGFADIDLQRFDSQVDVGASPRLAAERAMHIGPVSRLVREMGEAKAPAILDAMERAFASLAMPDGKILLDGSTWIVSARNPR